MQSVAKHPCFNQSFYIEQLSFWNDKENHVCYQALWQQGRLQFSHSELSIFELQNFFGTCIRSLCVSTSPVANIKTLLIEGSCPPVNCCPQGYRRAKLVSNVKKFYGRHHDLADRYNRFLTYFWFNDPSRSIVRLSIAGVSFSLTFSTDIYILRAYLLGRWSYYSRAPDHTSFFGVHVCVSNISELSIFKWLRSSDLWFGSFDHLALNALSVIAKAPKMAQSVTSYWVTLFYDLSVHTISQNNIIRVKLPIIIQPVTSDQVPVSVHVSSVVEGLPVYPASHEVTVTELP